MSKLVTTISVLVLLLASCEKVDLSEYLEKGDEGIELTFTLNRYAITDFDDVNGNEGKSPAKHNKVQQSAGELGTVVNFAVFKDGEKVKTVNQKNSDEDFGTVKMVLPAGDYHVVALVHSCSGNATISTPDKITFPNNKVTDTFAYTSDITVSEDQSFNVELQRVVAMFRFIVEDAIPDDVAKMQFYYTGGSSTLDADSGFGCVNSRQTEIREVMNHAAGQVFEVYTFPHDVTGNLNMTVTALDASGNEYAARKLDNVPVEICKVTSCSTSFFDGSSSAQGTGFSLSGDGEWKGEIEYVY